MDFQSTIEDINEVTKQVKVEIPATAFTTEFNNELAQLAKTAAIKGFRPGKAPQTMVQQLHGDRIKHEVTNRLISKSLQTLVKQNKLDMVGYPEIDLANVEDGKSIKYTASISIYPSPVIKGYEKFEVSVPEHKVEDKDLDEVINKIAESKASIKKNEFRTKAKTGDVIDATLQVVLPGETPGRAEPLVVGLGEGRLPAELESAVVGMEIGEKKEVNGILPQSHPNQEMRGKDATYIITLLGLSDKVLPEINDQFAKDSGLGAETLLELRIKVRERLENEAKTTAKNEVYTAAIDQLMEKNKFLVPQSIVDDEIRSLLVRNRFIDSAKVDPNSLDMTAFREHMGETALQRVRTAIAVDKIAEAEGLKATEQDIALHLKQIADTHGIPLADVNKFFEAKDKSLGLQVELTRTKVLELIYSRTKVSYVAPSAAASSEKSEKTGSEKSAKSKKTKE